jgi:O-antigen/teichoic acid export membrane protein
MAQTVKKNFLYNLLLQVSKVLFPLVTAPYIARVLDPEGVGIANFVNTYSSYFALFAVLGIPLYGIREIAKKRNDLKASEGFVSQIISIELFSTLLASLFYLLSVYFVGQLNENATLFLFAGIALYITPFKVEWFFCGREEFGYITFRSLLIKAVSVFLLFVFVRTKEDILNYILLGVFATIVNEMWNYVKLYKMGIHPRIRFKGCAQHLRAVLALFASSIAISIYAMLDTLMLGFQSSYQEVGYYNSAMHVIKALLPVATSLSAVAIPRVATYIHEGDTDKVNELMNKSLGIVSFLAFPLTIGIIMVSPSFVPLFFGNQFYGAILPMQIASVLLLSIGLNNLNGIQVLISVGKDRQFLYSVLGGAIANFLLNLYLIPEFGAAGAAFSSVYAETQILIVNECFVRKKTSVRVTNFSDLGKAMVGALCFIPICIFIGTVMKDWIFVCTCIIVCTLFYAVSQYVLKNSTFNMMYSLVMSKISRK